MSQIFVDTSAFAALADHTDDNYARAVAFNRTMSKQTLITTNYVLDELYTLLLLHVGYPKTIRFKAQLDQLITKQVMKVIWITEELATQAWDIFKTFNVDKQWSFTDCTSYVVMLDQHMTEAFTFDHHFTQMGFIIQPQST